MVIVGLIPAILMIPLRRFLTESPRWLVANGRHEEADRIVTKLESSARASGKELPEPKFVVAPARKSTDWRELFQGIYLKRTLSIWAMWFSSYLVANGTINWLPTLYRQTFNLPLETSIFYGFVTSVGGVIAAVICALLIDKVGRKRWYTGALLIAPIPLVILAWIGATSATQVLVLAGLAYAIVQTVTFSLYLYSAEIYPTRLRAIGTGTGISWLRLGSSAGPIVTGFLLSSMGIQYVFAVCAAVLVIGAIITAVFAVETKRSNAGRTFAVMTELRLTALRRGPAPEAGPTSSLCRVRVRRRR